MAYSRRLRPKGVSILGFKHMKGRGLIVEAYERVKKSVISVSKNDQRGLQMHFWPVIKYIKLVLWFTYMLKKVHLQQFEGMQSSKLGKRKQYRLLKEGIWKGYLFCHK